jgi:hypothetical protein
MEGRWVAFVPALLGCFASEDTRERALAAVPEAIRRYAGWRRSRGDTFAVPVETIETAIDEIAREWPDPANPDYVVNAFFAADTPPLNKEDIALGARLLDWAHADLLAAGDVATDAINQKVEGEWSIGGILNHCSRAEWWYLDRLGLAPRPRRKPETWQQRFSLAHRRLLAVLPALEGSGRIVLKDSELWSPRKMLRRAIWHERDHTQHIYKFRSTLGI